MRLQLPKCEALRISNKRYPPTFTYLCDGKSLQWSSVVRYLGVYINQLLTWINHCKLKFESAWLICCIVAHNLLSASHFVFLSFNSLIQHSCPVWLPHYNKDIHRLEAIQNCVTCWICGRYFDPLPSPGHYHQGKLMVVVSGEG